MYRVRILTYRKRATGGRDTSVLTGTFRGCLGVIAHILFVNSGLEVLQEIAEAIIDNGKAQKYDHHANDNQVYIRSRVDGAEDNFVKNTNADSNKAGKREYFETFSCLYTNTGATGVSLMVNAQMIGVEVSATESALFFNRLRASSIITGGNVR